MKNISPQVLNALNMFLASVIAFLAPVAGVIITVIGFVLLDTRYAYLRVKKNNGSWTSRKLRVGLINKLITYVSLIILLYMTDKFLVNYLLMPIFGIELLFSRLMTLVFIYIEYLSIEESYKSINGYTLYDKFRDMLRKFNHIKNDIKNTNEDKLNKDK